jgi:hypothetical protein
VFSLLDSGGCCPACCLSHRLAAAVTQNVFPGWLADVRNRVSLPFRQAPADPAPLAGVRASPSGRYLLALFRWVG